MENIKYLSSSDFIIKNIKLMFKNSDNIYVYPNIPDNKLNNAIKAFKVEQNNIVAIYDNTILGIADEGICFSGEKIVIKSEKDFFEIFYKDIESIVKLDLVVPKKIVNKFKGFSLISKGVEALSKDENQIIFTLKDGKEIRITQGVRNKDEYCFVDFIKELISSCDEELFKDENLLTPLEDVCDEVKKAYLKIIVNMSYEKNNKIDAKEQAEILLLMTKIRIGQEREEIDQKHIGQKTRAAIREYMYTIAEKKDNLKDLLKIMQDNLEPVQYKNTIFSLIKDLINVHYCTQDPNNLKSDCKFIEQNMDIFGINQDQVDEIYHAVKQDYRMLREEISDDMYKEMFKDIMARGASVGVPIAAVYLSGSVVGLSATGITSGLAALGMGGVLGFSSMLTGIGVVVLLGVAAYQGVKWLTSDDKLSKYQMRQLMLQEILKLTQRTISEIIEDINYFVAELNKAIKVNNQNKDLAQEANDKIQRLTEIIASLTSSAQCIENKNDKAQGYLFKLEVPKKLNISKLEKQTKDPTKQKYYDMIIKFYEEKIDKDGKKEYYLKEDVSTLQLEAIKKVLSAIGYRD